MMNSIHVNTVSSYWLVPHSESTVHNHLLKENEREHWFGLLLNTFRQNHFGPERGVTQAAGLRNIHSYGQSLKYMYSFEIKLAIYTMTKHIYSTDNNFTQGA